MGPQHPQPQLGLVSGSPVQHHDGRLRYLLPVPASDSSVVFGFPVRVRQLYPRWHTGLCGCCTDPGICLLGCCCPCILFGRIASELDDGATSCVVAALIWYILQQFTAGGCGWIYSFLYRDKLRARYGIPRHPGCDCVIHFCCWPCAFCQEYRELRIRRSAGETSMVRRTIMAAPPRQVMRY
ncbi:hypothetical protein KP509_16G059600 [Ceratopteris richardii]|nr:hypothetical protein KP509_16G059600 [Ceratopteris richardii]